MMVKDLLLPNRSEWDTKKIKFHLLQYVSTIQKLTLSTNNLKDERIWLLEKSDEYSTKTGYALAKLNSGNIHDSFNWKQCIWNVKCSPKLKHFL